MGFSAGLGPLAVQPPRASAPPKSDDELLEESLPTLHLAGNATVMLRTAQRLGVAAVAVVLMVHEGDNLRDGVAMAAHTDALLHLFPSTAPAAASATSTGAGGAAGAGAGVGVSDGAGGRRRKQPRLPPMRWIPPSSWLDVYGPRPLSLYN